MEKIYNFSLENKDGKESYYEASVIQHNNKLDTVVTSDEGFRANFEILKEGSEIIVNTTTISMQLPSHAPLYLKLQELGRLHFNN